MSTIEYLIWSQSLTGIVVRKHMLVCQIAYHYKAYELHLSRACAECSTFAAMYYILVRVHTCNQLMCIVLADATAIGRWPMSLVQWSAFIFMKMRMSNCDSHRRASTSV